MGRSFGSTLGWTTLAPAACIMHCALTPLLVVAAPSLGASAELEWGFLVATVALATPALAFGVRRHSRVAPIVAIAAGLVLWVTSLLGAFAPIPPEASIPLAAMIVAAGLVWSTRLAHRANSTSSCECPTCRVDP